MKLASRKEEIAATQLLVDDADAVILREILDATLRDVRFEIADTDNAEFKARLRQREQMNSKRMDIAAVTSSKDEAKASYDRRSRHYESLEERLETSCRQAGVGMLG